MKQECDVAVAAYNVETNELREFLLQTPNTKEKESNLKHTLPKISIVMPSYNQLRYLERSILSVLNQGYPNLEFIIIDGGSTDGSIEIIKKYGPYLSYWHSGPDSGQSDALNHGFSKATGDIYGWLHSDDLYLPSAFSRAAEVFLAHSETSVVFGDWWEIDSEDEVTHVQYAFDFSLGHFIYEGFHCNAQGMFWRREAHERFGLFDILLHRTMDYDLIQRLGLNEGQNSFFRIPYQLGCFRRHEEQKTQGFDRVVYDEHRQIALKNGLDVKYTWRGKILRLMYRFRRAFWYVKRGGFVYFFERSTAWRMGLWDMMNLRHK